jgi:hypothetical protein
MIPRNQLTACIIKQSGTGLYRSCVSLEKDKTICLSTHQDERSATETINHFLETVQKGEIETLEDVLAFVNSIRVKDPERAYACDPTPC